MLTNEINDIEIKKVFKNKDNKVKYLTKLFEMTGSSEKVAKQASRIDDQIITTWNYLVSKNVIRSMFMETEKYTYIQSCKEKIDEALREWHELGLGELEWPFSAMNFDQHVHQLNRNDSISETEKDEILKKESVIFRRIKQINALRNDYIEYLIFKNENVIPTFGNNRGVDFYINGKPFDQKVAKSVGKAFQQTYGEGYRNYAISHPDAVAISLYENQDEERFGDEARLLIIYLDSDVTSHNIEEQLSSIDFNEPMQIGFDYKHSNNNVLHHETECFVILLHN